MGNNKIEDLRSTLFETIELLKDEKSTMTVEKAKAIAGISQTIINTAKLEIDFIRAKDKLVGFYPGTGFIDFPEKKMIDK